ncbi:hypothetical protein QL285_013089 [Trifolium repens]|nr:hypothetical protein QL285_013089 [Trifolium repens]
MADNNNPNRSGRGTGRSINRGRGSGRGRGNITWPQPSALHTQMDTQPPHSNGQSTHLPTSQTPSNVQPSHSTPNPDISSAPSLSIPLGVTSADGLHASSSRDNSYPKIGSKDSTDGRIWICPGPKLTLEPSVQPTREITKIIKSKFEGCWANYGEIKKKNECLVELWYKEFQRKYKWLPEHEHDIKKAFNHKASDLYSSAMYRVRRNIDPGDWIPTEMREQLQLAWNENSWKAKSQVNTHNRRSSDAPLHTGGSISTTEHFKRMKKDSNVSPTCWALFQRTHKVKGDPSKWVSTKSEKVATDYEKRILDRDTQETPRDDVSSHQSDNNIFLDVVGGVDKKGRVFGLGPEAGKYKPFVSSTSNGISQSEYEHMRAVISNLSAENMTLKDKLKTHEDLIRASQEESISTREESRLAREESRLLREQFQQFMKTFSLGQSHLPPCPDSTT